MDDVYGQEKEKEGEEEDVLGSDIDQQIRRPKIHKLEVAELLQASRQGEDLEGELVGRHFLVSFVLCLG